MNCIHLKQKLNRTLECKKKQKIINIKECNNCKLKEYKKCTEFSKNSANHTLKSTTLHNKSAKLAKLEKHPLSMRKPFRHGHHGKLKYFSTHSLIG